MGGFTKEHNFQPNNTPMKKVLILSALLFVILIGCRKNNKDTTPAGFITATVDGATVSFHTNTKAFRSEMASTYSIQILGGFERADSSSNKISIAVSSPSPISTGTWGTSSGNEGGTLLYIQAGSNNNYVNNIGSDPRCIIIITEITSSFIKGTFSGECFLTATGGPSPTVKKTITDGAFLVPF